MASDAPLPEDELSWSTDVEAAQWWVDGLEPWLDPGIRSTVPSGFEAVTRIFHPIEYNDGTIGSWSALAAANGRQAHSGMQWHAVATPAGQPVSLTIDHPLDPYVSEGHLPDPGSGPSRDYLLLQGPLGALPAITDGLGRQCPNLWWPQDRAWFLVTEIDVAWTYVAGPQALVTAIEQAGGIEAMRSSLDHPATVDSDERNR